MREETAFTTRDALRPADRAALWPCRAPLILWRAKVPGLSKPLKMDLFLSRPTRFWRGSRRRIPAAVQASGEVGR